MAGLKEIKRRVKSVQNTSKITYAMKLVSAAKLRKVQDAVTLSRFYTNELKSLASGVVASFEGDISTVDPLLIAKPSVQKIGIIVVGGQRGLCGGYNTNLNKKLQAFLAELKGKESRLFVLGKKPAEYCRKIQLTPTLKFEELGESVSAWPIREVAQSVTEAFLDGEIDECHLVFTKFRSAISMTPVVERVIPVDAESLGAINSQGETEKKREFEPSAQEILSALLPRLVETQIRQAALDAKASETASRMTAMDSATRNAKQLSKRLQLLANRLRQQRITSELLDIIGGAEAVK